MKRLNITLPDEIAEKLDGRPNKSRFIAEVLKEKFNHENLKKLDRLLVEGYKATASEEKNINDEWEKASLETWD